MFNWVQDRYSPHSFQNYIIYNHRIDVIGVEINTAESYTNRTGGQNATFYNTQGKGHLVLPAQTTVKSSLYIPASWADPTQGSRRTDLWVETFPANTDYAIIGFTNYQGPARYRVWTELSGGSWQDLVTPVQYDQWTDFKISYDGNNWTYYINGVLVLTMIGLAPNEPWLDIKLEVYNFTGDPSITGAFSGNPLGDYTAFWTNPYPLPDDPQGPDCGCDTRGAQIQAIINSFKLLFGI
jgi:hypothetical protein